jgi:eukaryotic-like serine/threonine-protein kinase
MTLVPGTRLGPYEILGPLGAGGMGEVYRAKDTRLDRDVAVKVLPEQLSTSADFKQRFEREAKAISSLNHPNICALYDVGSQDGMEYLVMELLEGETLSERLKRGPMTTEQVRRHGMEISEALDRAHRQGIVHRDLKPGNVMMTPSGAKLMDFGLAKPGSARSGASGLTSLPTQTTPLTSEGTLVGTFQYMSPEQLEGKDADARSDIFALGAVLYEMATGRRAFEGKSQISVMAAILEKEPVPMSEVQPMAPPALERLVQTCLRKDPEERLQSARDVKLHLEWIGEAGSRAGVPAPVVARRKARFRLAWILAAAGFLLAAVSVFAYLRVASVHPRTVRSYVLPPEKTSFAFDAATGGPELSPNGTRIVFSAIDSAGKKMLWVRPLDSLTAQPLEGTEDASFPFWSPDSRFVGFFAPGKLKKIDTAGGPPQSLCTVSAGRGGTWNAKGVILFTPDVFGGIQRVPSAGGAPTDLLGLDKEKQQTSLRWPAFLPDGRHFLYWGGNPTATIQDTNGIFVGSLDDKTTRFLCQADSDAAYAPPGYLLYLRDRSLMAQPFDAGSQKLTGEAFPVAEEVANRMSFRLGCFSVSTDGTLVYQTGENVRVQPVWLNAAGGEAGTVGELASIIAVRFSPDGKRLAEEIQEPRTKAIDLWLLDLDRNVKTRFTFDAAPHFFPVWSPDAANIAYSSSVKGHFDLYTKSASGAGEASLLLSSDGDKYVSDWSRDGRYLAFTQVDSKSKTLGDIFILPLFGDRKPFSFLQTTFNEGNAVFSPDGRWVAYQSNESGKGEVYIMPFPQPGGKWQVSQGGGLNPRWRPDGQAVFYRTPDDKLMEASVSAKGSALEVGTPKQIAKVAFAELGGTGWVYDVAPKGDRFIFLRPEQAASTPVTLVTHWVEGIKR